MVSDPRVSRAATRSAFRRPAASLGFANWRDCAGRLPQNAPMRWSNLESESTPAWADLTNLLATVEGTEEFYSAEDLAEELTETGFDPLRDSWAVWDGPDLVAFGQLRIGDELVDGRWCQALLDGGVHPDRRGQGIGTRLMDAMEARARQLAAERHPGAPLRMRAPGRLEGDPVRRLLEHRGYRIARYFTDMQRPLPGEPLGPPDPRVQPYRPEWQEAVRQAHNEAFADHWGSTARTEQAWNDGMTSRSFRPGTSTVCLGPAGEVLAYVLTYQWVDRELYVGQVGTRRSARGQGLARACLGECLRAAAASGEFDQVDLTVDSANPTGAGALYESVGFTAARTMATYVRDEGAPAGRTAGHRDRRLMP